MPISTGNQNHSTLICNISKQIFYSASIYTHNCCSSAGLFSPFSIKILKILSSVYKKRGFGDCLPMECFKRRMKSRICQPDVFGTFLRPHSEDIHRLWRWCINRGILCTNTTTNCHKFLQKCIFYFYVFYNFLRIFYTSIWTP